MHIRRWNFDLNPGPLVHSAGEEPLRNLLLLNLQKDLYCIQEPGNFKCIFFFKLLVLYKIFIQ